MDKETQKEMMHAINKKLAIRSEYIRSKFRPVVQQIKNEFASTHDPENLMDAEPEIAYAMFELLIEMGLEDRPNIEHWLSFMEDAVNETILAYQEGLIFKKDANEQI